MSDNLFNSLQKLFESNERRFDLTLREFERDDAPEEKESDDDLPIETHASVFPQPGVSKGIIYLNPLAIPNDYSKGHVVCILKVDKSDKKVRADKLKNAAVHVPFSIIKKDESGREYVTKDDVKKAYTRGSYIYHLLKLQPAKLDRHVDSDKFGRAGDDAKRIQATNPNVEDPSGEMKGDKKAQDALRRGVDHREAGTRGDGESPQEFQHRYGKDLDTGVSSADLARDSKLPKPGTPEWTAHIAKLKSQKK